MIEYLEAENAYTESVMAPLKTFEYALIEEMKGRIKEGESIGLAEVDQTLIP